MSAVRSRRHEQAWWEDEAPTQAIPTGAVRSAGGAATIPFRPAREVGRGGRAAGQGRPAAAGYAPRTVALPMLPALPDPTKLITTAAIIGGLAVLLYLGITGLIDWTRVKRDDMQYGRPRTAQLDAFVGHGEGNGVASHFVALNLNRRVTILEFPGGDVTKPQVIAGPYLFGRAEDLTVVMPRVEDVNGDEKPDLIVQVKDERLVYINDGATFRPITADELARLKEKEGGR